MISSIFIVIIMTPGHFLQYTPRVGLGL